MSKFLTGFFVFLLLVSLAIAGTRIEVYDYEGANFTRFKVNYSLFNADNITIGRDNTQVCLANGTDCEDIDVNSSNYLNKYNTTTLTKDDENNLTVSQTWLESLFYTITQIEVFNNSLYNIFYNQTQIEEMNTTIHNNISSINADVTNNYNFITNVESNFTAENTSNYNTFVPYTGATKNVDLNNYNFSNVSFIGVRMDDPQHNVDIIGDFLLTHTATGSDEHGLELKIDADGYGDVKGLDIFYDTGAIFQGKDEGIILITIDEFSATGGDVMGLEIISTEGLANIYGLETGAVVNPVVQLSGIFDDMDSVNVSGVDRLSEFISTGSDVEIFTNDNDYVIIGDAVHFEEIEFILDTIASKNIKPTFEYSTGIGTWGTFFPVDGTNGFENNGVIVWLQEDIPSWTSGVGGEYLIRINRTRNNINTAPIEDFVQISTTTKYIWNKDGDIRVRRVNATNFSGSLDCSNLIGNTSDLCSLVDTTIADTNESTRFNTLVGTNCGGTDKMVGVDVAGTVECAADQTGAGGDAKAGDLNYLYNDTDTMYFNDTKLNETIDERDTNETDNVDALLLQNITTVKIGNNISSNYITDTPSNCPTDSYTTGWGDNFSEMTCTTLIDTDTNLTGDDVRGYVNGSNVNFTRIGINVSDPQNAIHIKPSVSGDGIRIDEADSTNQAILITGTNSGGAVTIKRGGTNQFIFTASGDSEWNMQNIYNHEYYFHGRNDNMLVLLSDTNNIGVNTPLPNASLHIVGDSIIDGQINSTNWTNVTITESQISDLTHTTDTDTNLTETDVMTYVNGSNVNFGQLLLGLTSSNWLIEATTTTRGILARFNQDMNGSSNVYGVHTTVDGTNTNNYIYYGSVSGGTTDWGLYITGEDKNYLSGNLGIGTNSPESKLHIVGEGAGNDLTIVDATPIISINDSSNGKTYEIGTHVVADELSVYDRVSSAVRFHIDTAGNVGVGSSHPDATLDVYGSVLVDSSGANGLEISDDRANGVLSGRLFFANGTSTKDFAMYKNGNKLYWTKNANMGTTSGSSLMYLQDDGLLSVTGTVDGNEVCGHNFVATIDHTVSASVTGGTKASRWTSMETEGKTYTCVDCIIATSGAASTCSATTALGLDCEFEVTC